MYTKKELKELIKKKLAREFSEETADALWSCYVWRAKECRFVIRKTSPSFRKAPHAWAAWRGFHILSPEGRCEGTVATLMIADETTRKIWDEVSDFRIAVLSYERSASLTE